MRQSIRAWRLRCRLFAIYLMTGHPRFKPLYVADVVSFDRMAQAEFLANAGYHVAAAMMVRQIIEGRVKRMAMISPKWRDCRAKNVAGIACFLKTQGIIGMKTQRQIDKFYSLASNVAHGDSSDRDRCLVVLHLAAEIERRCKLSVEHLLAGSR